MQLLFWYTYRNLAHSNIVDVIEKQLKLAYLYMIFTMQPLKTKEYNRNINRNRLELNGN